MSLTTRRAMHSEWTKFRSVRSSKIVLIVSAVLVIGMAGTVAALLNNQWDKLPPPAKAQFDPQNVIRANHPIVGAA